MIRRSQERAAEDQGVQEIIELIRRRMVAETAGSIAGSAQGSSALQEHKMEGRAPITAEFASQSFTAADADANAVLVARHDIDQERDAARLRTGLLASLRSHVRRWLKWYTDPADLYWDTAISGLDHIVSSLKTHNALLQHQAVGIRNLETQSHNLMQQLDSIQSQLTTSAEPNSGAGRVANTPERS
jgi:hypothetical protein